MLLSSARGWLCSPPAPSMRRFQSHCASLVALAACVLTSCGGEGITEPETKRVGPPARLTITSGDGQRGPAGAPLPAALVVTVVDSAGTPVPGQVVSFVVTRGSGRVFAGANASNAAGVAQDRWTLGTSVADSQRVEARALDNATGQTIVSATFTATVAPAAAATVTVTAGAAQSGPAGTLVAVAPRVRVADEFGNLVPGAAVAFAVTAGGGAITGGSATTDSAGGASVGSWTLGPVAGVPNSLTATVNGIAAAVGATSTSPVRFAIGAPTAGVLVGGGLPVLVTATTLAAAGSIASVAAVVEGRTAALAYDATAKSWSAVVPMNASTAGAKTLTVTATDQAGNASSATVPFSYAGAIEPTDPLAPTYVRLQSDAGDYIGDGRLYSYTRANAVIAVTATGGRLSVRVNGDESWYGDFLSPGGIGELRPGSYTRLERYPFNAPGTGGLAWSGEGRGCNTLVGSVTITRVTYVAGALAAIDLLFEQHCDGRSPALRGTVHWRADDLSVAPGPVVPPPATLWKPAAGSTPPDGGYVYLQSDAGDYIGEGRTSTYAQATSGISVAATGGRVTIAVAGWRGDFQAMNTIGQLQPGYYADLRRYPFHNPVKGGLSWSGNGRGCNTLAGWFVVDAVTYVGGVLTALDLRFAQHCEGRTPALRGAIRWTR